MHFRAPRHVVIVAPCLFALALLLVSCGETVVGQPCSVVDSCPRNFDCAIDRDRESVCAFACNFSTETLCPDGTTCLPIGSMGDACYAGGRVRIGGPCEDDLDCVRGGICLVLVGGTPQCAQGCNVDEPDTCPGSAVCTRLGNSGFCP